jgi:uncharacterized membrane protein YeaQ/YmgE (transglycosylase-associated protein family)
MTLERAALKKGGWSMDLAISLSFGGWALLIAAAVVFGLVAQFIGETRTGWEGLIDAVAFGIGALVASEFVVEWRAIQPVWEELALVPALLGGLVVGLIVEVITRLGTGGRYTRQHPMSV